MSTDYTLNDYDLYAVVDKSKKKYRNSEGGRLDKSFSKSTTQVSNISTDIYAEVHKMKPKSKSLYGRTNNTPFTMTSEFTVTNSELSDEVEKNQRKLESQKTFEGVGNDGQQFSRPESSLYAVIPKGGGQNKEEQLNHIEKERDLFNNESVKSSLSSRKYCGLIAANILAFSFLTVVFMITFSVVMVKLTKVELDFEQKQGEVDMFMSTFVQYMNNYNANLISISHSITLLKHTVQNIIGITSINSSSPEYFTSCSEIAMFNSSFPSGNYSIMSPTSEMLTVYCDLNRTFGGTTTGWRRIASMDVNSCPQGLETKNTNNSTRTCANNEISESCTNIFFPISGFQYTKVAGRVRGYANGSMECFESYNGTTKQDHQIYYLDGVTIVNTHEHIWSFAAGCDCNNISNIPPSVGEDFTADETDLTQSGDGFVNLLWESQQCNKNSTWFLKVLSYSTSDITVRICHDRGSELAITVLELYVQ